MCLLLISAANTVPNSCHRKRTLSWLISVPRSCGSLDFNSEDEKPNKQ